MTIYIIIIKYIPDKNKIDSLITKINKKDKYKIV